MSNFKYAYKPGFSPAQIQQRKAKAFADQYYQTANLRQKVAINNRRMRLGLSPLATRGFFPPGVANRERKYSDKVVASYNINTTGNLTLLHNPTLGSDFTNRIGRKTTVKSIYIRGYAIAEPAATPSTPVAAPSQMGRMIIFIDNQPNGAAPAVTDLLVSASPAAQLNPNNRDRFKVLKDKTFVFDPILVSTTATQAIASIGRTIVPIKFYKKCNIESIFNATNGGTIADINTGAIYMLFVGSNADGLLDSNAIVSTRLRFDDN